MVAIIITVIVVVVLAAAAAAVFVRMTFHNIPDIFLFIWAVIQHMIR